SASACPVTSEKIPLAVCVGNFVSVLLGVGTSTVSGLHSVDTASSSASPWSAASGDAGAFSASLVALGASVWAAAVGKVLALSASAAAARTVRGSFISFSCLFSSRVGKNPILTALFDFVVAYPCFLWLSITFFPPANLRCPPASITRHDG